MRVRAVLVAVGLSCLVAVPGYVFGQTGNVSQIESGIVHLRLFSAETRQDGGVAVEENASPISRKIKGFIKDGKVDEDEFRLLTKPRLEKKLSNLSQTLQYRMVLDVFKWHLKDRWSFAGLGGGSKLYQVKPGDRNLRVNSLTRKVNEYVPDASGPVIEFSNMDEDGGDLTAEMVSKFDDEHSVPFALSLAEGEIAKVGAYVWVDDREENAEGGYDPYVPELSYTSAIHNVWTVRKAGSTKEKKLAANKSLSKFLGPDYDLFLNVVIDKQWFDSFVDYDVPKPDFGMAVPILSYTNEVGEVETLYVKSGDILVRLGESVQIAAGTAPVPSFATDRRIGTFENDPILEDWGGGRFAFTHILFNKEDNILQKVCRLSGYGLRKLGDLVHFPNLWGRKRNIARAKAYIDERVDEEYPEPYAVPFVYEEGQAAPAAATLDPKRIRSDFGNDFKNVTVGPELSGPPYNLLRTKKRWLRKSKNPYRISMLDDILHSSRKLQSLIGYYPGTIFLTHVSIVSVEEGEEGYPEVWMYDAYPEGIRKEKLTAQLGYKYARAGGFFRVSDPENDPEGDLGRRAIRNVKEWYATYKMRYEDDPKKKVIKLSESETLRCDRAWPVENDPFGYDFRANDQTYIHCSELIWLAYLKEGTDLISNYSTLTVPIVMAKKFGWRVESMIQASPQALILSDKTIRIADMNVAKEEEEGPNQVTLAHAVEKISDTYENPETGELELSEFPIDVTEEVSQARQNGHTIIQIFDHPEERLQLGDEVFGE